MEFNLKGVEIDGVTYFVTNEMITKYGSLEDAVKAAKASIEGAPKNKTAKSNNVVAQSTTPSDPAPPPYTATVTSTATEGETATETPND
jgi:uncharacterized protein YggE